MSDVTLSSSGPPETILPDPDPDVMEELAARNDITGVSTVVAAHPTSLDAWASLGEAREATRAGVGDDVAAYSAFRVGYHRGLDALRKNGWKGSGYVRWAHPSNRGFLRCLDGLRRTAEMIGETEEELRCAEFLQMLDPQWGRPVDDGV